MANVKAVMAPTDCDDGKSRLETSTLYMCDSCLDDLGPIPGTWKEEPLDKCSICGEIDLQSREEMDAYHHDMSNRQWEEDEQMWQDHIAPEINNPQELK